MESKVDKREKCIILGPSGSGKDYLKRKLVEKGLIPLVKYTTRPKRTGEVEGVEYRFVTREEFEEKDSVNSFWSKQEFTVWPKEGEPQIWLYGISAEDFENSQVMILTPGEFSQLSGRERKNLFVVYLDIPEKIRRERIMVRRDPNDNIDRRIAADALDFQDFGDYDLKIRDHEFDVDMVWDLMY